MQSIGKRLHYGKGIAWHFDSLPKLEEVQATGERYDLIILSAVWMHLPLEERREALESIINFFFPAVSPT